MVPAAFFSASNSSNNKNNVHLIISAVGKDRLGIISDISKHVTEMGGNVGESQATKLGSYFSMMMLFNIPAAQKTQLETELAGLAGMTTTVIEADAPCESAYTPKIAYSGRFELEGANYPGIVHKVTSFLSHNGLSVDKLETSDEIIAPHGGTVLFQMKGVANALEPLASGFDIDDIQDRLAVLADELNCDITMEENCDDFDGGGNQERVA